MFERPLVCSHRYGYHVRATDSTGGDPLSLHQTQQRDAMKIICFANQKGGVGKTTGAVGLFWYLAERGYRVIAVDLDQQGNLSSTLEEHRGPQPAAALFCTNGTVVPERVPSLAYATPELMDVDEGSNEDREAAILNFRTNLLEMAGYCDVIIIDTPPAIHIVRTIAALFVSTAVIAPIELADYSIDGVATLKTTLDRIVDLGRDPINFLGLMPSKFDRRSPREIALYNQLKAEFADNLFPAALAKRDAYARASSERRPVWKIPGTASREAATEIRAVMELIEERAGLTHGADAAAASV